MLWWQQPMEKVWLVSYLFKQCFTLFITSVTIHMLWCEVICLHYRHQVHMYRWDTFSYESAVRQLCLERNISIKRKNWRLSVRMWLRKNMVRDDDTAVDLIWSLSVFTYEMPVQLPHTVGFLLQTSDTKDAPADGVRQAIQWWILGVALNGTGEYWEYNTLNAVYTRLHSADKLHACELSAKKGKGLRYPQTQYIRPANIWFRTRFYISIHVCSHTW